MIYKITIKVKADSEKEALTEIGYRLNVNPARWWLAEHGVEILKVTEENTEL